MEVGGEGKGVEVWVGGRCHHEAETGNQERSRPIGSHLKNR